MKKQSKADKAFIEKISTLQINTKSSTNSSAETKSCGCGSPLHKIGHIKGEIHGKEVESDVYGHSHAPVPPPPRLRRATPGNADEVSFSA